MADLVVSHTTSEALTKLADLLEQASRLARRISQTEKVSPKEFVMPIPKLQQPKHTHKNQEWFWTEEWQEGEREVNKELAAGHLETFDNVEELLANLHAHV